MAAKDNVYESPVVVYVRTRTDTKNTDVAAQTLDRGVAATRAINRGDVGDAGYK